MSIFKKIIASFYYLKGKKHLQMQNDIEALNYFRKAEKYENDYDISIHKGLVEFILGELEQSIISYQYALKLVTSNNTLNQNEKEYLRYYILEDLLDALNILQKYGNIAEYEKIFKAIKFDKNKIRKRILMDFPMEEKE